MKIALVNPYFSRNMRFVIPKIIQKVRGKYPPLGLIVDAEAGELSAGNIAEQAADFSAELVGITITTWTVNHARKIARAVRKKIPDIRIAVGGPQVKAFPRLTLKFSEFDYGVIGEGDMTFPELVDSLENNKPLSKVKGVVFRKSSKIIQTPAREYCPDLDKLPSPSWHLLPIKKYHDMLTRRKQFMVMITSRGCPFNCTFCDPRNTLGKQFRAWGADRLFYEVKVLYDKYGIREIMFFDDLFTFDRKRVIDFCRKMIKSSMNLIWDCRTRVNCIDEELIKWMKKAGCYRVRFGVESGNQKILNSLNKGITLEQVRRAFALARKYRIESMAYYMLGSPGETKETLRQTIDFAVKLDSDYALFAVTSLMPPGSSLFAWAADEGYIARDYWERFVSGEKLDPYPTLSTPQLPEKTLRGYHQLAHRCFYLRPIIFFRTLRRLRSWIAFKNSLQIFISLVLRRFDA